MSGRHPIVFLGAGPGDPELITVKGMRAMERADLILYAGSLVSEDMLKWAGDGAEIVDTAPLNLNEIVRRMETGYNAGLRVVRVHSGDPSIYGAIKEHIDELDKRGIPCEVIPGVTSATAAAAALHRELTLPEITQTVIITRAAGRTPVPEKEALGLLAGHRSTMAIYLSTHKIETVVRELTPEYGPDAPVAVAYRVSWPEAKYIRGTLADIAEKVKGAGITKQALILVGPAMGDKETPKSKLYDETFSHEYRGESETR